MPVSISMSVHFRRQVMREDLFRSPFRRAGVGGRYLELAQTRTTKALLDVEQRRQPMEGCHGRIFPCTPFLERPDPLRLVVHPDSYTWQGTHNCYCWVMGSGDHERHITFIEHKAANYNADGTFIAGALDSVTYPYRNRSISSHRHRTGRHTSAESLSPETIRVGYTTDLANFQLAVTADHSTWADSGFDGETTITWVIRRFWRDLEGTITGARQRRVPSFYLDDVLVSNFPCPSQAEQLRSGIDVHLYGPVVVYQLPLRGGRNQVHLFRRRDLLVFLEGQSSRVLIQQR